MGRKGWFVAVVVTLSTAITGCADDYGGSSPIIAIDTISGDISWTTSVSGTMFVELQPVGDDVYYKTRNCDDDEAGAVVGTSGIHAPRRWPNFIGQSRDGHTVFVLGDAGVTAHSSDDGDELWTSDVVSVNDENRATAVQVGELAIIAGGDGTGGVYGFELDDGTLTWSQPTPRNGPVRLVASHPEEVVLTRNDWRVLALDAAIGDGLWTWPDGDASYIDSLAGAGDAVGVSSPDNDGLTLLDAVTGAERWSVPDIVAFSMSVDRVIAVASDGAATAYDLVTGDPLWDASIEGIDALAAVEDGSTVVLHRDEVTKLMPDGTVAWTTTLSPPEPRYSTSFAVTERRTYVAFGGGGRCPSDGY